MIDENIWDPLFIATRNRTSSRIHNRMWDSVYVRVWIRMCGPALVNMQAVVIDKINE